MSDDLRSTKTEAITKPSGLETAERRDLGENGVQIAESCNEAYKFNLFKNRWLTSILVVTLFVSLCYGLIGLPFYATNDDTNMTAIVSGTAYLDRPDEHTLFTHVYLGLLLKHLYSMQPGVPWYGLFQITTLVISMSVITWLILGKSRRPFAMLALGFGVLLVTCTRSILLVQFTTTAALAACAAVLLLMECVERWHLRNRALVCMIGAATMLSLAALIRDDSANLVLGVTTILLVARWLPTPLRQWRKHLALLLSVATAFAVVFVFSWTNLRYYDGEWKDFFKINHATSAIREYRCDQVNSPLRHLMYQHVGWTPTDATLFLHWYSLDDKIYSAQRLTTLAGLMKEHQRETFDRDAFLASIRDLCKDEALLPMTLPILLLIPFVNRARVPYLSWVLIGIGVLSLCTYIILCMKLPMRVMVSILLPVMFFGIRYVSVSKLVVVPREMSGAKMLRCTIDSALLLGVLVSSVLLSSQLNVQLKYMAKEQRDFIELVKCLSAQPVRICVSWAGNLRVVVSPFTDVAKIYKDLKIIPIGAIGRPPFVAKRLQETGITNLLSQLDKEDMVIISNESYNRFIRMHAAEKLGKEVVFTKVPVKPMICQVFKVKYKTPDDPVKLKRELDAAFLPIQETKKTSVSSQRSNE